MSLSDWFAEQLRASADGFVWAIQQVPSARRYARPPFYLGEWSAARHAFHLLHYERSYALSGMQQWLGQPLPDAPALSEDAAWAGVPAASGDADLSHLLDEFQAVRRLQIALLPDLRGQWEQPLLTLWGTKSLRWVVTKTYQHTAEHTHDVLSLALFWDQP